MLLRRQGDVEGAEAAYRRAIDSGHAKFAQKWPSCSGPN